MIQCPYCGHWVSDDAKTCPHCGYRFHSIYARYSKADNKVAQSDKVKQKQSDKTNQKKSTKLHHKHQTQQQTTHRKPIHHTKHTKKAPVTAKKNKQGKKRIESARKLDKSRTLRQHKHINKKYATTHTNVNKRVPVKNYFTRDFLNAAALVAVVVCGTLTIKSIQYRSTPHVNATSIVRNIENNNPAFINHVRYNKKRNTAYIYLSSNGKQIINFGATENLKSQLAQREGNVNHTNGQFNITHTMYHANEVSKFTHSLKDQKAKINKKYPNFKLKIVNKNGYVKRIHDAESESNNNWKQTKVVARKVLNGNHVFTHQFKYSKKDDIVKIVIKPKFAKSLGVNSYCKKNHITSGYVPVSPNSDSKLCSELTRATYRIGRATRNFNVRVQLIAKVPPIKNMSNTINNNSINKK